MRLKKIPDILAAIVLIFGRNGT